jgi:hypothetical protein
MRGMEASGESERSSRAPSNCGNGLQIRPFSSGTSRITLAGCGRCEAMNERSDKNKVYDVEEFRMGDKTCVDRIVFASVEELEQAYRDLDNGNDIYVRADGLITKVLHKIITNKIYEGSLILSALDRPNESKEE